LTDRPHLSVGELAGYIDHTVPSADRTSIETHLAECDICRRELVEVGRVTRSLPRRQLLRWAPLGVGVAAVVLLYMLSSRGDGSLPGVHRGSQDVSSQAPVPIAPLGDVVRADTLRWSPSLRTDRYRARLIDGEGRALFLAEVADTLVVVPDSVVLRRDVPYYWKVEGRIGWDRWVASPITMFTLRGPPP
jgi:hypothetical protein